MRYEEFIDQVRQDFSPGSQDEALRITRATLETLGERIYRTARQNLAAQLPDQIKELLVARTEPERSAQDVDQFSMQDFYHRVSARAEMGYPRTLDGVKVVMQVMRQAVSPGIWEQLKNELSADYDEIMEETEK